MILKRFYDDKLAQASYLVGCAATGEALVVDPNRDVGQYLAAAAAEGLRVTHVTETHIHADFVSGARELALTAGATLHLSGEGGPDWSYRFAASSGAVLLHDGDSFMVGRVRIDAVHTPGHTPEHLAFVLTDTAAADRPMGVFTGDFVFVGDVGRPDLLERAAHLTGTMEAGARQLFHSLRRFRSSLPDYVQLWPGHGAGSACGKALGAVPQTTLGYEKLFNWGLTTDDEEEFVRAVLAGQPEPPMYFAQMKRINREGPAVLGGFRIPPLLPAERLPEVLAAGGRVVDLRPASDFAAGHLAGAINVPLGRSFSTWAGSVLPFDAELHLVLPGASEAAAEAAVRDLAMIGIDRVAGRLDAAEVDRWLARDGSARRVAQVDAEALAAMVAADAVAVIDVRNGSEWEAGRIPGSRNLPLGRFPELVGEVPRDRPVVVHCQAGSRASVAISVLQAGGHPDVAHLRGDFAAWSAAGHPVERGSAVAAPA